MACYSGRIAKTYRMPLDYVIWHLWLPVGRQLLHFALRNEGFVTIKPEIPAPTVSEEEFDRLLTSLM